MHWISSSTTAARPLWLEGPPFLTSFAEKQLQYPVSPCNTSRKYEMLWGCMLDAGHICGGAC